MYGRWCCCTTGFLCANIVVIFHSAKYCDQLQMTNLIMAMVFFSILIYVSSNEIFECLLVMVVGIISHLSWFKQWGDGIYSRV